jgi:hypothetical protein
MSTETNVNLTAAQTELQRYWTPVPVTAHRRGVVRTALKNQLNKAIRDANQRGGLGDVREFHQDTSSSITSTHPIVYHLDGTTWDKTKLEPLLKTLINNLGLPPEKVSKTKTCTSFMHEGILVKLYHLFEEAQKHNQYFDSSYQIFYLGYGGMREFFNIILNQYNFEVSEFFDLEYLLPTSEGKVKYSLHTGMESVTKIMGTPHKATYGYSPYYGFTDVASLVKWLFESKYIGKSTFYINEQNVYTGPENYFRNVLFQDVVNYIIAHPTSTAFQSSKTDPVLSADKIEKAQLNYWSTTVKRSYPEMIARKQILQSNEMLNQKLSDSLIKEIVGSDVNVKTERSKFKDFVSGKEDFEFFVLSSSEETLRKRLSEYKTLVVR